MTYPLFFKKAYAFEALASEILALGEPPKEIKCFISSN
jgi:hypothetical protein